MNDLSELTDRFLGAQSVFDRYIRESEDLEFLSRLGFMATEICLMVLEDTSMPVDEMCERIAAIFDQLAKECHALSVGGADTLSETFQSCYLATLQLSAFIADGKTQAKGQISDMP